MQERDISPAEGAPREGRSLTDMHMLLYRVCHAQTNYLRLRMAKAGLGPGQPMVLSYLAVHGPSTQCRIARAFDVDGATISRMLDSLQKGGFVTIGRGMDGRTREAALTDRGHEALAIWEETCDEETRLMLSGIDGHDKETLARCLCTMYRNLAGHAEEEAPDA